MNMNIPLSGMANAAYRLGVSANNVANINTQGYRARSVVSIETEGGGVRVGEVREAPSPGRVNTESLSGDAGSNVDLAEETVGNALFAAAYRANATVARTQNELLGTVLNMRS